MDIATPAAGTRRRVALVTGAAQGIGRARGFQTRKGRLQSRIERSAFWKSQPRRPSGRNPIAVEVIG